MNNAGITYYTWPNEEEGSDSSLISGFLTALNMFAQGQSGEVIKEITLNLTTYIFNRQEDLIFVILTRDKEFEDIIRKILLQISDTFLDLFLDKVKHFSGEVSTFQPFYKNVESILKSHGYFDYLNILNNYNNDENFRSVLYLDNTSGNVLYSKAKVYFDRDILGFQSMVLIKAINRALEEKLNEELEMAILVTSDFCTLEYKNYENITIVYENRPIDSTTKLNLSMKPKIVNKMLKTPGKLHFEIENPFLFMDSSGIVKIQKDPANLLNTGEIAANSLTIYNTSRNIIEKVYKETLYVVLLITSKNIYSIFNINEYLVISLLSMDESPKLKESLSPVLQFQKNFSLKDENFIHIMNKIQEFRDKFT
jgi:hypothetical protein